MTNNHQTKDQPKTADEPKPTAFGWSCSNKHASVREFADEHPAKRAARNHRAHNHGSNECRKAKTTIVPIFAEVGDQ